MLPPDATVVVVSKGDEELLELGGGRRGLAFPAERGGVYAGYYPADGAEAIVHLEELREKGAGFLLVPRDRVLVARELQGVRRAPEFTVPVRLGRRRIHRSTN